MPENKKGRKVVTEGYEYPVIFANNAEVYTYRKYMASIISANIQEQVPAHMRVPYLKELVKNGLISPASSNKN